MKNEKIINMLSVVCYGVLLALSIVIILISAISIGALPEEGGGLAAGVSAVVLVILIIIGAIQSIVALIPFVLKLIFIKKKKIGLPIVCMIFDLIFAIFYISMLLGAFEGITVEIPALIFSLIVILIVIAAFVFNVAAIRFCKNRDE